MITTMRVCRSKGIFNEHFKSVMFQHITDISLKQSLWDKILNTGTIIIRSSDGTDDDLLLKDISRPVEVKKILGEYLHHVQSTRMMNLKR
jgi:hypothetical protein